MTQWVILYRTLTIEFGLLHVSLTPCLGIPFRHELAHALNTAKHRVLTCGKHCIGAKIIKKGMIDANRYRS